MTDDASPENLRKFLESDDPAMVRMGLSMAKGAGVPDEILEEILWMYMFHDDKTIRAAAKSTFIKLAPEDAKRAVKENWKASYRTDRYGPQLIILGKALCQTSVSLVGQLIKALGDEDWGVREAAAGALDKLGWVPETDGQRAAYLIAAKDWKSLVEWGEPAVEPLIKALSDEHPTIRKFAAEALGKLGEPAVNPLIEALGDEDGNVRWYAADVLGGIGDARAVEPLIKALEDGNSSAVYALGRIGDARAVEPLIRVLSDDDVRVVRLYVAEALGKIGDKQAVEPLIEALGDDYSGVRDAAAKALGKIGDARAVEPLTELLSDDGLGVSKAAKEALCKLGHEVE